MYNLGMFYIICHKNTVEIAERILPHKTNNGFFSSLLAHGTYLTITGTKPKKSYVDEFEPSICMPKFMLKFVVAH